MPRIGLQANAELQEPHYKAIVLLGHVSARQSNGEAKLSSLGNVKIARAASEISDMAANPSQSLYSIPHLYLINLMTFWLSRYLPEQVPDTYIDTRSLQKAYAAS